MCVILTFFFVFLPNIKPCFSIKVILSLSLWETLHCEGRALSVISFLSNSDLTSKGFCVLFPSNVSRERSVSPILQDRTLR